MRTRKIMIVKKTLLAMTILLSGHAALCMEYDLCKDKDFFKSVKNQLQNSDDPFYLESPDSKPVAQKKSLSNPIDFPYVSDKSMENSSSFDIEPQKKRKAPKAEHPPKRIKTTAYTITCPDPKCNLTITNSSVSAVAQKFLVHTFSKKHNKKKFNEVKNYIDSTKDFVKGKWKIRCMIKDCTYKIKHIRVQVLPVLLMTHLCASPTHNKAELEEIKKSIATIKVESPQKNEYKVPCHIPGCSAIITATKKYNLKINLLKHIYSKKHNEENFNELKDYVQTNIQKENGTYQLSCPNCNHTLRNKKPASMTIILIEHLYFSKAHKSPETKKIKADVTNYIKTVLKET